MVQNNQLDRIQVVVADDDPIIRQLFESKLSQMGCDVKSAEDGGAAWKVLRSSKHVDLAIVDLDMPNVDGLSLIHSVRSHPRTRHLPIVVVTSRSDADAIQEAFNAGATSFLTKPVHWATLYNHISYLMRLTDAAHLARNQALRAEAAIRVKDIVIQRSLEIASQRVDRIQEMLIVLADSLADGAGNDHAFSAIEQLESEAADIRNALLQGQSMSRSLCKTVNNDDMRVPLLNLIANAQIRVQKQSRECNVPISVIRAPEDAYVACDPDGLSLAISHLLDNAVRFSQEGQTVTIEADIHSDGMMTIVINDDGPGMDPDFYAARLSPSRDQSFASQPGTEGIGLPLVKAIAEAHGGVLEIRSMPGQGTTAMFVVPADRVQFESEYAA